MIKIQTEERNGEIVLQVEGRLAGAFVPELERCWQAIRAKQLERKISVDLKNVTSIDRAGRQLLRSMHSGGVSFLGACLGIQDILDQVRESRNGCGPASDFGS